MLDELFVNILLQYADGSIKRVLWINDDQKYLFLIDINSNQMPYLVTREDIEIDFNDGSLQIEKSDQYIDRTVEHLLPEKQKEQRDKAWDAISEIALMEPDIYYKYIRRKLIVEASQKKGVSIKTIYEYLKKYWIKGKNKNALLPSYQNCGNPGKSRIARDIKLGRPRKNPEVVGEGINITENIKKIFEIIRTKYNLNPKDISVPKAYEKMLQTYFSTEVATPENKVVLVLDKKIPSITQFRYWLEKRNNEDIENFLRKRKGNKKYELESREILGRSDREIIGPGSIYQIDATIADVYLVSRYNKEWIVGRPVIYFIVDVFSRIIAGLYVGLEGPSWVGAMMAMANTMIDKVQYCKEYGINIKPDDWPCRHAPASIYADRGEMISRKAEQMIKLLGISVENEPSQRADLKGIVERKFRTIQGSVIPLMPGAILKDFRKRGAHDYRLDGTLDIEEFTKIIILSVMEHNNSLLSSFERNQDMISDNVIQKPLELWKWGIRNRSGNLNTYPEDLVKLSLMPVDSGKVTERGILFKSMYFSCEKALREKWFVHARNKGNWNVSVSYDPRNMNNIYLLGEGGRSYDACYLLDESRYGNRTSDEINYLLAYEKLQQSKEQHSNYENSINTNKLVDEIMKNAQKGKKDVSSKSIVSGIKTFRKKEKTSIQKKEAFVLNKPIKTSKNVNDSKEKTDGTQDSIDILQKLQDEYFERKDIK